MARLAASVSLMLALVTSISASGSLEPVSRQRTESVIVSLAIDKPRYSSREEMRITLTVHNRTRATVSYQFPSSQQYDFSVVAGKEVFWTWSYGKAFAQAFTTLILEPSQSRTFNLVWDLKDNNGKLVPVGNYTLVAMFPAIARSPRTPERLGVPFSIVQSP